MAAIIMAPQLDKVSVIAHSAQTPISFIFFILK
jgi:hypothetical protein